MTAATLGEVADFINGFAFKPGDWGDEGHPIIRIQNLTDPTKSLNRTSRSVAKKYYVETGDLLVSWSATLGVFAWDRAETGLVNQHIFRVVPNETRVTSDYLRHMLVGALADMERHLHGATMKHVNRGEFLATRIPLPPLEEQRRIAAILDQADAIRAKRRQALAHLGSLTQSIFDDMFGRSVWPIEKLGDRLQFLTSGSRGWAKYYAPDGDKFIRIQNVKGGYLNQRDMAFVAAPDTAEARRTAVQGGDVLLSITADLGRTAVVPDGFGRAYINQHLAILRAPSIQPRYLADFLESPRGQREVLGKDRGATKAGLNFDDVRSVALPIPPSGLQAVYAERVERINAQRARTHLAIEADDTLFQSLQVRAFRGEL